MEKKRKKHGIYRRLTAFLMLLVFNFNVFGNNIVVDPVSIGTRATKTASGIDQIDIARPNARGTSYNRLSELQVSEQGLILNNNKQVVVDTEIAGLVARNRNLDNGQEANLIITEVTGKNMTNINGYVEVAGKRADIVIANRNGIAVNGGGFLNVSRATLTTGSLQMVDGDLVSIDIEDGKIKIGEKGVDVTHLDYFDILSKTVDIAGIIKGGENTRILISTGSQVYEYKTKKVESKGRTYEGVAVDGKAMGSMYAGKIDIISNDKGAGVNTKGDLVSIDDITITASGDITTGKVESTRKVAYKTTKKVKTTRTVTAGTAVTVKAKEVEIDAKVITGYLTEAAGEKTLDIEAEKVSNKSEIQSVGKIDIRAEKLGNSGEIYSEESININSKDISNKGTIISNNIDIKGNKLDNTEGRIISETVGLGVAEINNTKGLISVEKEISFNGKSLDNTEGKIITNNAVALGVDNVINVKGLITGSSIDIEGKTLDTKEGQIITDGNVNLKVEKTDNTKGQIIGDKINIKGKDLNNTEGQIVTDGNINLKVEKTDNTKGQITGDKINIKGKDLNNTEGQIIGNDLNLNTRKIENTRGILLAGDIKISAKDLENTEGAIQASNLSLDIKDTINNTKGLILGEENLSVVTKVLKNIEGQLLSNGELKLETKEIDNTKGQISGELKEINGDKLINEDGKILTNKELDINVKNVDNTNGEIYSAERIKAVGDILNNVNGEIHSAGKIEIEVKNVNNTKGYILADGIQKEDLEKKENSTNNNDKNEENNQISDKTENRIQKSITITGDKLNNTDGTIAGIGEIGIGVKNTDNTKGKITGNSIEIKGINLNNTEGILQSNTSIALGIDSIINIKGIITGDEVNIKAENLDNTQGQITANDLILDSSVNNTKGLILSNTITLKGRELINKEGSIKGSEIASSIEKLDNTLGNIEGLGKVELLNLINNGGKVSSDYYISIRNTADLENTNGVIDVKESEGGIEITLGKDLENSGGQIVTKGVVLIDSLGDMTLEGKIEGLEGTKIEANTLTTREIINNKATLELIGRNGVVLNNDITAKILSIESGSNLDINNKIHGEDGLSLKAKDITNKNEITSGDYLYIKSDGRLENTQNGLIYSVGDQILEGQIIENNRGRIISNGSLSLIGDGLVRNNVGNIHSNGDMYIQVSNGNFENIGHTQTIIDEVISRVQVKNTPQSLKGRLKSQQQGENNTELLTVTRTERLGATESSSLTSSGNITIIGKDIHNTEGSIIKSDKDIQIQGENLYNTSTAVRNNNDITLVKGSTIEGNEVILDISQRIINGFYDLGGMETRNDGVLIDHRTGVQTQLAKIAGVNGTYILAGDFENRGIIGAGGTTYIDSKNRVINENVGNLNTGQILGEAVAIEGLNGVRNIGGLIRGEKAVQITSANGQVLNESTIYSNATYTNPTAEKSNSFLKIAVKTNNQGLNKITEGLKNIGRIESNGQVYIDADSIRNVGGIIAGNEGTYLKAKTDIEDTSISLRSLDHNVVEDGRKWDTVDRTVNVSGQIGNGGDTILSAGRDILLINSDLRASNDIVLNAKRYITSLSVLDTEYRYAQTTETKKKSFGRKKTTVKTWIEDNEYANGTQMTAGRHILMNYVGTGTDDTQVEQIKNQGIFLQGADLLAQGEIVGMSDGNIYTQGTRDKLGSFYEEKTSKSILGFSYSKSRDTVDSSQERYKLTQMYAGAGISYDSEGKLIVEGADIQTAGNLYLRGKQGVYLLPGTEDGYRREEHVKEGLTANFDVGRASVSAGVGYEKNKDTLTEVTTNIVNNQIQVGGNYYAKSEEGDYTHIATNLLVDGDMKIDAKNINILDAQAYRKIHQTSERTYVGVGVTVGVPIVESAYQIKDSYEALEGAKGTEGYINAGFQGLNTYFGAVSALANPIGVSGSITASYSKSEYNREESISVGSNIIVKGSTEFNGENLHIRGSNLQVGENLTYNITNDIVIEAGKSTLKEDGKSVGYGVSIGKGMLGENGIVNPFKDNNMTVTPSISQQKSTTTGEFYNNSQVYAAGNTHYNVGGDLTVKGGNVETGTISGKIAGNVTIESVQDKVDSKSQGFSASYGIGLGEHTVKQGNKTGVKDGIYTSSIGLGYNQGSVEQKMTTRPSSFIAGAGELEVGQKVKQVGSLIDGGFTLNTKEYEVENVKDINKETNFGINLTIYPGVSQIYENGRPTAETTAGVAIGTQLQYGSKDYEAINQATIGKNVKVLIEGKEADLSGINRDVDNMVKVTKDKTVEQIDIDLSSENWGTSYGREKFKGELADATNNVDRVVQVAKATFEKGANPITLFQDRIAYEEARDSGVLDEYFGALLDSEKAKGFINDLGYDVEDVQIISLDDPNIKEILGAEAIAGRVYYTKDGSKIIIIADNARDMANAMGTLGEEARHSYYRNEKGMTDSEKYASFYGEQIERYLRSEYGSPLGGLGIDSLSYTSEQLGKDWEDNVYWIESTHVGGHGAVLIVNDKYPEGRVYSWSAIGPDGMRYGVDYEIKWPPTESYVDVIDYGSLYIALSLNDYLSGRYGTKNAKIHKIDEGTFDESKIVDYYVGFIIGGNKRERIKYDSTIKNEGTGSYYEFGKEKKYRLFAYNCVYVGMESLYFSKGWKIGDYRNKLNSHTFYNPPSAVKNPILNGKTELFINYQKNSTKEQINDIVTKIRRDAGTLK